MGFLTNLFIVAVIVADILAIVYFGGRTLLDGSPLAHAAAAPVVVAAAQSTPATGEATAEAAPAFDYATYTANADNGARIAGKCKACHTFDNGGPNRTGPNLWGIVDAPVGHAAGFAYSDANSTFKATHPAWTEDTLFTFLENPRGVMEGTKMQFNGIKNPAERADLIAWLKTLK